MKYNNFKGKKLSNLGFGLMRLPVDEHGNINVEQTKQMIDYAIKNGVNYFDTAAPYHGGYSEIVTGEILSQYPRESFYLADKFPGHQLATEYNVQKTFEIQLRKCQTDYFDFYLLHNVYENSVKTYYSEKWGIIDYLLEQKKNGRIKHLGFSTHARLDTLKEFLNRYGSIMEFCQIQLNYLDWTLQDANEKVKLLNEHNIPIWVMEPVRGGKLAILNEENTNKLKMTRPEESSASWAFRWVKDIPGVTMILSGMSNMQQVQDNIKTFSEDKPLSESEKELLSGIAENLKNSVPCTGCGYCIEGCPQKLNIPLLIKLYNNAKFNLDVGASMSMDSFTEKELPKACIGCGKCSRTCPQSIDVPGIMQDFAQLYEKMPKWSDLCKTRAAAAAKLDKQYDS